MDDRHPGADQEQGHRHHVEQHGVDTIPAPERTARPRDLVSILWGGNLSLSVTVFGWLVILYGLSWWASVAAIVAGTLLGSVVVAPLAMLGLRSATNNSVASGAYFGVRGRLIASVIGLLLCLGYVALTVWTGGDAVVGGLDRAFGVAGSDRQSVAAYLVIAVLVAAIAIYGYRWLVRVNNVIVPGLAAIMLVTVIALGGSFDASYAGTPSAYALGTFWPTWLLAALTSGVAGPVSYVTQTGDWTRYISPDRHPTRRVLGAAFVGLFVGLTVPTLFGAFVSVVSLNPDSFSIEVVQAVPTWLLPLVILFAVAGSLGQGGMNLYSMGLDLDAILPRLSRTSSTIAVAAVSTVLVFLGKFVWSAESAVTTFVVVLTSLATPWAVITMIGFARTRGRFHEPSLQVFNRRETGGAYWFSAGWNTDAAAAWTLASVIGVLSNSTSSYEGPISKVFGGIDVSFVTSAFVAALAYYALVSLRPHRHADRLSRPLSHSRETPPTGPTMAATHR